MCVVVVTTVVVSFDELEPPDVVVCELDECDELDEPLDECDELDEPPDVVELEDDEF